MLETLRRGYRLIEPGTRGRWLLVLALAVTVTFVEAIGAFLIFFVVNSITDQGAAFELPVVGDLRERFPGVSESTLFTWTALAVATFFLLRAAVYLLQAYAQNRVAWSTGRALSSRLVAGYLRMPYEWHLRRSSAETIRTAYESVGQVVVYVFVPIVQMLSEVLLVAGIFVVLLVATPIGTLLAVVVLALLIVPLLRILQPRLVALGRMKQVLFADVIQSLQQGVDGMRDVKILGRQEFFHHRFDEVQRQHSRLQYLRETLMEIPRVAVETTVILLILAFLVVNGVDASTNDQGSLAILGLFGYAVLRVMPAINRMVRAANSLRFGAAASEIVAEDLERVERASAKAKVADTNERISLSDRLTVEDVWFRFEGSEEFALRGIRLEIRRAEAIGIVGPTGGGKSTLVDVILGLLEPTAGVVRVDGRDIRESLPAWHRNLGVVAQTPYLIEDSLRRNIALGLDDDEIDEAAVWDAVRLAQLESFVAMLPGGLDADVGERGVRLSGGQRQRVAIARALYRKPDVLVFDEGTSALDSATEADLIEALDQLRNHCTTVMVAHRLSTVRDCDTIVLLQEGRVMERGTYDELLVRSPEFRRLAGVETEVMPTTPAVIAGADVDGEREIPKETAN